MRIHTYAAGGQAAVTHPDVQPGTPLRELLAPQDGDRLYLVGQEAEIDASRTAGEVFGDQTGHVIAHHCRQIAVTVTYATRDKLVTAHPSTLVKVVRAEAIKEFTLSPAESADLVLRLPGSTEDLVTTNPIGAYVPMGTCAVTVDLVHVIRPQG
ncbi:MAG TPA: hypothetical protein VMU94_26265 [Streptosporangiaceae bacterium]|nr:hypothetical protein [Streptosporangiaceae bacterium]